ncbi:MAG: tyrosine-type recombinase/integrase [Steroidobacteraceae bacterium]
MKITTTWLEARRESRNRPGKRYDVTVDGREGLMVRVSPSGAVSFRFRYSGLDGARRVMVLGEFGRGGLSLKDAHDLHYQASSELEKGLDPIEERARRAAEAQRDREARENADTVASLVEQFTHRKLRAERWDEERAVWARDAKAKTRPRKRPEAAEALLKANLTDATLDGEVVGQMKAQDLTRRQLVRLLDAIVDRGAPVSANRVHALLVQMFNWAAARDFLGASPMAGIERPGGDETPRDRVLTADEIRTFWTKLDTAEMAELTRLALKLLLVTGQRRGELTFAKWSHLDLNQKLWTIPVSLLKSAHSRRDAPQPHLVPLSPLAIDVLKELQALTGESEYVLPAYASKKAKKSYTERVLSRAVRQNAKHFDIPHFTPHDLRRTAASFMTKLGIPRLHVEKVLNHSTGEIAEVYDRHDYLPEKRAALERWGEHLQALIEGSEQTVVPKERRA